MNRRHIKITYVLTAPGSHGASDAGLKPAACGSLKHRTPKSPSGDHRTTLSRYIFTNEAHIDNQKENMLSSNISSTCPHNMVNFGPLAAEIDPVV